LCWWRYLFYLFPIWRMCFLFIWIYLPSTLPNLLLLFILFKWSKLWMVFYFNFTTRKLCFTNWYFCLYPFKLDPKCYCLSLNWYFFIPFLFLSFLYLKSFPFLFFFFFYIYDFILFLFLLPFFLFSFPLSLLCFLMFLL